MQFSRFSFLKIAGGFALASAILPSAEATSRLAVSPLRDSACVLSGEFLGSARKENGVAWRYRRLSRVESAQCRNLSEEFEVWIPGGGYSTLSETIIYPGHIVEPKPGQRFSLRLIYSERPARGWFHSGPFPRAEKERE